MGSLVIDLSQDRSITGQEWGLLGSRGHLKDDNHWVGAGRPVLVDEDGPLRTLLLFWSRRGSLPMRAWVLYSLEICGRNMPVIYEQWCRANARQSWALSVPTVWPWNPTIRKTQHFLKVRTGLNSMTWTRHVSDKNENKPFGLFILDLLN